MLLSSYAPCTNFSGDKTQFHLREANRTQALNRVTPKSHTVNLPAVWETQVLSLGWENPPEKGMVTHSSILARKIPWTEEPGRLPFVGSQRVRHNWVIEQWTQQLPKDLSPFTVNHNLPCHHSLIWKKEANRRSLSLRVNKKYSYTFSTLLSWYFTGYWQVKMSLWRRNLYW